jgi:hypothetical protein
LPLTDEFTSARLCEGKTEREVPEDLDRVVAATLVGAAAWVVRRAVRELPVRRVDETCFTSRSRRLLFVFRTAAELAVATVFVTG